MGGVFPAAAPVNHSVGVVTARLSSASSDPRTIMYAVVPGSIRAVHRFGEPVTSASAPYDYTVRCFRGEQRKCAENYKSSQGRIKHLVGPTHFTMPGPQSLC